MKSMFSFITVITFSCITINFSFAQKTSRKSILTNPKTQLKSPGSIHTGKVIAEIIGKTTEEEDESEKYDNPRELAKLEFEKTKDPRTGKVPKERLLISKEKTKLSKQNRLSQRTTSTMLSWTERGPDRDFVGRSNQNLRPNNGVTSGRINALMIDSADLTHKTVWIGATDGGIWKTADITASPANWIPVSDNLNNLAISGICQDPTDYNIMYFCTGDPYVNQIEGLGVFKSIDHGVTWNPLQVTLQIGRNATRILCDYRGNIYLATKGNGLWRSAKASGGAVWTDITPMNAPNKFINDLEISSTATPARLHIVTGSSNYYFTDIPDITTPTVGWQTPSQPFVSNNSRTEIGISGSTLYACVADQSNNYVASIYKSNDGGLNWFDLGLPYSPTGEVITPGQAFYDLTVGINPANPNECIVGGLDNWKTTDGGITWNKISKWVGSTGQYVHADQQAIAWFDGGRKLIFASDGGIFFSADGGTTIRDRNVGLRIKQFYSVAMHPTLPDYFLGGSQDNGMHQLTQPGLSYSIEIIGGDGMSAAIDQAMPQYQFGSIYGNRFRRSVDGGVNWYEIDFLGYNFYTPFDYDNKSNVIYASYSYGNYLRWDNPKTSISSSIITIPSFAGKSVRSVTVSPYTPNRVYFGLDGGTIIQIDGANSGAPTETNLTRRGMPTGFLSNIVTGTNDQNLMAVFSNYGIQNIWISNNGGNTWTAVDGNLPDMPVRYGMFFPGDDTKAYIATETGVWETDLLNGGSTIWNANPSFPSVRTDMIKYSPSNRTIAAATFGRGIWTAIVPLPYPGSITTQPINSIGCEGRYAQFSVIAIGSPVLSYQWFKGAGNKLINGILGSATISGATTANLIISNCSASDVDNYYVVVSNAFGSITSTAAHLSVLPPPVINSVTIHQPSCISTIGSIVINATGGATLEYSVDGGVSWQLSNSFIGLAPGNYKIDVRLQGSPYPYCIAYYYTVSGSNIVVINSYTAPIIGAPTVTQPTCLLPTGTIIIKVSGSEVYDYSIDGITWQLSNIFSGLSIGNYSLSARSHDVPTCMAAAYNSIISINNPLFPKIRSVTAYFNCSTSSGSIDVFAAGCGTLEYSIDNGMTWQLSRRFRLLPVPASYNVKVRLQSQPTYITSYIGNPIVITPVPIPTVDQPPNQIVCNGQATQAVTFSGSSVPGTIYNWYRYSNYYVNGIEDYGDGILPSFIAVNTGNVPIVDTIEISPQSSYTCYGFYITFTITINPTPVIVCPGNIVVNTSPGLCSALVNYLITASTSPANVTYSFTGSTTGSGTGSGSGSIFNKGVTTVTITSVCGGQTCTFNVTVNDMEKPSITCLANQTRTVNNIGCTYKVAGTEFNPTTFSDNCNGATIINNFNNTGTLANAIFPIGSTVVEWTVIDVAGNTSFCTTSININSSLTTSIPDIYPVQPGGEVNTIYTGYGPSSVSLNALVSGGTAPYFYKWTAGSSAGNPLSTNSSFTITPTITTTYYLNVKDAYGCTVAAATKNIKVIDVRCGNNLDMVTICRLVEGKYTTKCINTNHVSDYLSDGSYLGVCIETLITSTLRSIKGLELVNKKSSKVSNKFNVMVSPNPSSSAFKMFIESKTNAPISITIKDAIGRIIQKMNVSKNEIVIIGDNLISGIYFAEIIQGVNHKTLKLIKLK